MKGIDVSHYQGTINFQKVKNAGIDFVYVKATEGSNYVDPTYATDFNGAKQAGLDVGWYHFGRVSEDPILSADFFANTVRSLGFGDLPLILDIETTGKIVGASSIDAWAIKFLDHLSAVTGHKVGWYSGEYFAKTYLGETAKKYNFSWIAKYSSVAPSVKYMIWQNSQSGHVDGISGNVDIDEGVSNLLAEAQTYTKFDVVVKDTIYYAIVANNSTYVIWTSMNEYDATYHYKGNGLFNINGEDVQGVVFDGDTYIPWAKIANGICATKVDWFFHK